MLEPWIIEEIRKREEEKRRERERPQPQLPVPEPPRRPPSRGPETPDEKKKDRGVEIIEPGKDPGNVDYEVRQ